MKRNRKYKFNVSVKENNTNRLKCMLSALYSVFSLFIMISVHS